MSKSMDLGSSQVIREDLLPLKSTDPQFDNFMIEQYKIFVDKTHSYWIQLIGKRVFS